ncbi:sensor histidine kinase [Halorubrum sp. FL23]|uniref:sensor histidine kinase n=1 Tax=Halorubrum sp. FL23 TaxID=3458704 RepID=UPI004034E61F
MERRPGVAYRRPDGDPTRLVVEAAGESYLNPEALPRSDWLRVVASDDRGRLRDALDEGAVDVTYRITASDECEWVHERGARDETGDVVGYLFPADERVQRRKQLEQQRERLEEFASVVSHDLRNPLSVAVGNIELAGDADGEAVRERLDRAHDALDYMDSLISDLLALAREGESVEETATTDLRCVVDRAWKTIDAPSDAALTVDEPLPWIECDQSRLRQALENVFRNAIEHGAEDGSPIQVFVGGLSDGFYVADDGTGIDPSERDTVFDPGHSADKDGTGFGLSIVERIAEAHGWEVAVAESRTGGARFEFTDVDLTDPEESGAPDAAPDRRVAPRSDGAGSETGSGTPPDE